MRSVDLANIRFDFDLTFTALVMNADGTIYHRYGTRDRTDAMSWISMKSMVKLLEESLEDHAAYVASDPKPPKLAKTRTLEDSPSFAAAERKKKRDCVHCHMVHEFERQDQMAAKRWSPDDIWLHPPPEQIGLTMDPEDQSLVTEVERGSAAHKAGIRADDRLVKLGEQRIRTIADIQWVLHNEKDGATKLEAAWEHEGAGEAGTLRLKKKWKRGTPLQFSWRSYKWGLKPQPGFGGPQLSPDELANAGLPRDAFAFKVNYLVTWGDNAHVGKNAQRAGVKKGDIVVSVGGKRDFETVSHFHAWFRLTQRIGGKVELQLLRSGKVVKVVLPVIQ